MKVVTAQAGIDKVNKFNWSIYRKTMVLVLIASMISFSVAWVVKGKAAQYGGVRWAVQMWAREHGDKSLTEERSYLDILKIPYYMLRPADVPQFVVDIDFKSFQKLQEKRDQALQRGLLITGKDDFVPAKIRHNGKTTKVKVRLKGDLLDHLKGDKWSFRVKVKGKNHIYGMRVLSVQSPYARGFQGAPLFYATLKRYGVLAPRYKLVNVVVNGSDLGVMSIEEHFSKELLESSGRKESVIIRFDESLVWKATDGAKAGLGGHFDNYHVATIDGFSSKKINKSERLTKDYEIAVGMLRAFETGTLPPSEVFDTKLMARYIAVSELWGSWHSFSWRNLRYYYNPISARLEPIGFDPDIQNRSAPGENRAQSGEPVTSVMRSALLDDPVIYAEFKKAVQVIGEDLRNGNLLQELEQVEQTYLPSLQKEFFLLRPFDQSELVKRIELLESYSKESLDEVYQLKHLYPKLLHAFEINNTDGSYIELANITPSLIDVLSIKWVAKEGGKTFDVKLAADVEFPLLLQPTPQLSKPAYRKISFDGQNHKKDYRLEVVARVNGAQEAVNIKVVPYYGALPGNPIPNSSLQEQALKHKQYLDVNVSSKTMIIKPGRWKINETIIVPKGAILKMGADTTLQFTANAGVISHGSLQFTGEENNRVRLQGINDESWLGMVILNAEKTSQLSYVHIKETRGMARQGWSLTGGITFYSSDVEINDSIFEDSHGEDALNIIHAEFMMNNVTIRRTASDAFDADFATGSVLGGLYEDIGLAGGGDAIDVSGSNITVENTRFKNIDDKAVSVGEQSKLKASGLDIDGTGTGAASKDGSVLNLTASKIHNARVAGLMAYIKKPEFGPGRIIASAINFGDGFEKVRAQKESVISVDNNEIETIDLNVKDMYKTVMKKGLR